MIDLKFSKHDPYCKRCGGDGEISDWPIHRTIWGTQRCHASGPTALLKASGPKGLEEGLRKLREATWWKCPKCDSDAGEFGDGNPKAEFCGLCASDNGRDVRIIRSKITTRVLVLDGKEKIDFGASDPAECWDCGGSGKTYKGQSWKPCPCRRYSLDGVDKVVLEDNLDPCSCDDDYPCAACDRSCNLADARESLAEQVEVVG